MVVGDTLALPFNGSLPRPLMATVVAPVVVQLKVDDPPTVMLRGLASKRRICGLTMGFVVTVTTAVAVTGVVPAGPLAVRV